MWLNVKAVNKEGIFKIFPFIFFLVLRKLFIVAPAGTEIILGFHILYIYFHILYIYIYDIQIMMPKIKKKITRC